MKKVLSIMLAFAMLLSVAAVVNAEEADHEHKFMKMANMSCHYEECEICFELRNVGEHTFEDGVCTVCGHPEFVNPFVDVAYDAWYHDEVVKAVASGIINGKTPTEFMPDDLLTYAEAVKLAACMNQVYTGDVVTLSNGEPWYQPYADYCKENKIILKEYNYNENATRAGYMEIFANALPDEAFKNINNIPDGSILDVKNNAPYAIYVYKFYRAGIVTGVDELHNCNPDANIKRSEVAAIISRMMDTSKRVKFTTAKSGSSGDGSGTDSPVIGGTDNPTGGGNENPKDGGNENPKDGGNEDPKDGDTVERINNKNDIKNDILDDNPDNLNPATVNYLPEPLKIVRQPEGTEAESYGGKVELYVEVKGGEAPYFYEWYYNGYRNQKTKIENGDYVKDASSEALVLSVEKENTLLGERIFCKIKDSMGTEVTSNAVKVYGPFSMPVDTIEINAATIEYVLAGRIADGVIRKGDKVSVERNGKIIAIGTAVDLQMFGKSLDQGVMGDNIGIVFKKTNGVSPQSGDIVIKYKEEHVIDTSDIVN